MKGYYYEYWAEYFNELDERIEKTSGVVFADSWKNAVSSIEQYYGSEILVNLEIRSSDDEYVYEVKIDKDED